MFVNMRVITVHKDWILDFRTYTVIVINIFPKTIHSVHYHDLNTKGDVTHQNIFRFKQIYDLGLNIATAGRDFGSVK